MDTLSDPPSPTQPKKQSFKVLAGNVLTIVAALIAVRITMSIPGFVDQFKEASFSPPPFTLIVIRCYPALLVIASIAALVSIYLAWRYRSEAPPSWVQIVLTIVIGGQVLIIGAAMLLPITQFMRHYLEP
jgi:hypothetical protein